MQRSDATAGVIGPPAAGGADSPAPVAPGPAGAGGADSSAAGVAGPSGVGVAGSDGSSAGDSTAGEEGELEGSGWDDAQPASARAGRRASRGRSFRIPTLCWSRRADDQGRYCPAAPQPTPMPGPPRGEPG